MVSYLNAGGHVKGKYNPYLSKSCNPGGAQVDWQ
jgi:hypothetical protein